MNRNKCIEHLESGDGKLQEKAALLFHLVDDGYSILPLMVEKAKAIDVNNGPIELSASNFVGYAAKQSARLIRQQGYSRADEFHRRIKDWIFGLNYCSEINAAGHSVTALGNLWTPPESVRERLIELAGGDVRSDNPLEHPGGTMRCLAFRELSSLDRETAIRLIDTPARYDFETFIDHRLDYYRTNFPKNVKAPKALKSEIAWLTDACGG